ncbi:hypothetical protein BH18GEM1_BH18GEM1_22110 [soil metagenome]
MIPSELARKVRLLEIQTRHLVNDIFSSEYTSVFKGRGVEFADVREYQPGDDVRAIDWNVTARRGTPYVKQFVEEREMTVILAVDGSASTRFGTQGALKRERAAEIAAVLGLAASRNNDRAGALLFASGIERYVPPRKGKTHVLRLVHDILTFDPPARGTNLTGALQFLSRVLHRRSVVFLLSDFLDAGYERALTALSVRHDVVALTLSDRRDRELPDVGLIEVVEPESGDRRWLDTGSREVRRAYSEAAERAETGRAGLFRHAGVDVVPIDTLADYVEPLRRFFERRERRRRRGGRRRLAVRGALSLVLALVLALGLSLAPGTARAQEPEPLLLDSTAMGASVAIRVVPENLRPVGGAASSSANERTVGDPFWVTVRTRGPTGYSLLPESLIAAYRPHPELAVLDSERRDGQLRLKLALFRPGDILLPTVTARVLNGRGDTLGVTVTSDTIRVASVLAPGDTLLADIKPLWKPRGVPAWVWALAGAILVLALALLAWWRRRRRRAPSAERVAEATDPYRAAREAIEPYLDDPPSPDRRLTAASRIGDALRAYLADGWNLAARERTTLEILPALPEAMVPERPALASLLSTVDLAKFARVAPEPGLVPHLARRALEALDRLEAVLRNPPEEEGEDTGEREAAS